jgi:hypothetical protein
MSGSQDHPAGRSPTQARRGGVRTSVLSLLTIAALVAVVVTVLATSLRSPENPTRQPESAPSPAAPVAEPAPALGGPEIAGTVSIARELAGRLRDTAVLFIVARKAAGPPFAVKRIVSPRFPLAYRLGAEDLMMAGSSFEGELRISARLARLGTAEPPQPGDLEGEHPVLVRVGARNVNITIARVR